MNRDSKRTNIGVVTFSLISIFLFSIAVFAAGTGSGSVPTPPPCERDDYDCSQWSSCSVVGEQTRSCHLKTNCPSVETPKPTEKRSCTPECTSDKWNCSEYGECTNHFQRRTCNLEFDCPLVPNKKPQESQSCIEVKKEEVAPPVEEPKEEVKEEKKEEVIEKVETKEEKSTEQQEEKKEEVKLRLCIESDYECSDWSQCKWSGKETRVCKKVKQCEVDSDNPIEESQVCPGLKCGHLETIEERMECRLTLSDSEMKKENELLYFPEYCRVEESQEEKLECVALYQQFGACWAMPLGDPRKQCAKKIIGVDSFVAEKDKCLAMSGDEKKECTEELTEAVEHFILFHLYELEIQAESLYEKGHVTLQEVVKLDVYVEKRKAEVETAKSIKTWKKIIIDTKDYWTKFISKI